MKVDPKELAKAEWLKCSQDCEYFIRNHCYILHPKRGKVLFGLYPYQKDTLKAFIEMDNVIVLKARQMGLTTLLSAYFLWLMLFHRGYTIGAVSLKLEVAKEIVSKIRYMNRNLPSYLQSRLVEDNRLSLHFANDSRIITHATTEKGATSFSLNLMLIDECALIPTAEELYQSSAPALSVAGGKCILCSTPRGSSGFFYETYMGAVEGKNDFFPIKLKWNLHPEHDRSWRDKEERALGSEKRAKQEYDCDFLTSGDILLDADSLKYYRNNVAEPIEKRAAYGLWVWQRPTMEVEQYYIFADVATGYGNDYSSAHIVDDCGEQVAEMKFKLSTYEFGKLLVELCNEYKGSKGPAMLVIERTGVGDSVCQSVVAEEYKNLVHCSPSMEEVALHYEYRSKGVPPGFATTAVNRVRVVNTLANALRDRKLKINSQRLMDELEAFVCDEDGNYKASNGENDDLVMSMSIGLYVLSAYGRTVEKNLKQDREAIDGMKKHTSDVPVSYDRHDAQPQNWQMKVGKSEGFDLRELL